MFTESLLITEGLLFTENLLFTAGFLTNGGLLPTEGLLFSKGVLFILFTEGRGDTLYSFEVAVAPSMLNCATTMLILHP